MIYQVDIQNNGAWNRKNFPLIHACHTDEDPNDNPQNGCCLKRGAQGIGADISGISSYVYFIKIIINMDHDKDSDNVHLINIMVKHMDILVVVQMVIHK